MHAPRIIAFTGFAQNGKSTCANAVTSAYGHVKMSFADPIRNCLMALGMSRVELSVHKEEPLDRFCGRSPRYVMRKFGTEFGRDMIGSNLWVLLMRDRLVEAIDVGNCVVIDDCRFVNEAALVRRLGGVVIRIARPDDLDPWKRFKRFLKSFLLHRSERGLPEYMIDLTIVNNAPSAEDLSAKVIEIVGKINHV